MYEYANHVFKFIENMDWFKRIAKEGSANKTDNNNFLYNEKLHCKMCTAQDYALKLILWAT